MAGDWQSVAAENIVRHKSGNYYLQAKVGGKKIRRSLKTSNLAVAKIKRDAMLGPMRAKTAGAAERIETLGAALLLVEARETSRQNIKGRTLEYYAELFRILRASLPLSRGAAAYSREEAEAWWESMRERSSIQANNLLRMLRKACKAITDTGIRHDDPTADIQRRKVKRINLTKLPSRNDFELVVKSIRSQHKSRSEHAALMVEFLAWSGCRRGEMQAVTWADVQGDWLVIHGGEKGTKSGLARRVPINPRLRSVLERLAHPGASGAIFRLKAARDSLASACNRVGVPRMRMHDLRHLFATMAIESGVDIPTVAKWMGHQDGGVLAMKTYGHLRDDHSLAAAQKLA